MGVGGRRLGGGGREIILHLLLSLHCHRQNGSCINMGSDETSFNVSLIVRDKVTRQCPQNTALKREESRSRFEPRSFCLPAYRLTARPDRLTKVCVCLPHTPSTAFLHLPPKEACRKPVLGVCACPCICVLG